MEDDCSSKLEFGRWSSGDRASRARKMGLEMTGKMMLFLFLPFWTWFFGWFSEVMILCGPSWFSQGWEKWMQSLNFGRQMLSGCHLDNILMPSFWVLEQIGKWLAYGNPWSIRTRPQLVPFLGPKNIPFPAHPMPRLLEGDLWPVSAYPTSNVNIWQKKIMILFVDMSYIYIYLYIFGGMILPIIWVCLKIVYP